MQHRLVRRIVALAFVAAIACGSVGPAPATVQAAAPVAQPACVEPNDEFQAACELTVAQDTTATIGNADDIDAYRFLVTDFDTVAKVALSELPAPYEAYIADWRGELIATSVATGTASQLAQAALKMPGVYYVFVRSKTGQFSTTEPYHLTATVDYGNRPARRVVWQQSVDALTADFQSQDGTVDYAFKDGRLTMTTKEAGTSERAAGGRLRIQESMKPGFGPAFSFVSDVRQTAGSDAGFYVAFGMSQDASVPSYRIIVDVEKGKFWLTQYGSDKPEPIVPVTPFAGLDRQGGVNRIAVHATETEIRVGLNGQDIVRLTDRRVAPGVVAIGSVAWGAPTTTILDNMMLTVPN